MAITDSSTTRIKARDAEQCWNLAPKAPDAFVSGLFSRGFTAMAAIHFNGEGRAYGLTAVSKGDPEGTVILLDYLTQVLDRTPADVLALEGAALLGLHRDGMAEVATWGRDGLACRMLGRWAGRELEALPVAPFQTWWGYSRAGVPTPLTPAEMESLSDTQQAWVKARTR